LGTSLPADSQSKEERFFRNFRGRVSTTANTKEPEEKKTRRDEQACIIDLFVKSPTQEGNIMYGIVLGLHNLVRWLVVLAAVYALVRAYRGWLGGRPWTGADRQAGLLFTTSMDIQFLLGLILYFFLSPITKIAMANFGGIFSSPNPDVTFFGIEHELGMITAIVLAHVGSTISRKVGTPAAGHRIAAILFTLSVVVVILLIPWSRPLFRLP
jgi:hypothetical protein